MELNLLELWTSMNPIVKGVVAVLTLQALWSITVTIDRLLMLFNSKRASRKFASNVAAAMQVGDASKVAEIADAARKQSHLARFIFEGVSVFNSHRARGLDDMRAAEFTKRSLERSGENLSTSLNKGLSVLATTGSTAPFVGLLGTVFGILGAFKVIGAEGGGGLSTIGPLIGEALYVTGYGLMVAIPTVMLFNLLSGMIAKYEAGLANAGSELVDQLESGSLGGGAAASPAASAKPTGASNNNFSAAYAEVSASPAE